MPKIYAHNQWKPPEIQRNRLFSTPLIYNTLKPMQKQHQIIDRNELEYLRIVKNYWFI